MFAEIRLSARRALLGEELRYLPSTLLMLIYFLAFSLLNAAMTVFPADIPETVFIFSAVLGAPLSVALTAPLKHKMQRRYICFYMGSRYAEKTDFEEKINSCILTVILFFLKLAHYAFFELIPSGALILLIFRLRNTEMGVRTAAVLLCGIIAAMIIGFIAAFVSVQKYSRAGFYLAAYSGISPVEAVKISKKRSENKLVQTAVFKAGFAPWFLLCILGVPILFVAPYYRQSLTAYFLKN